jgi:hypothetical protein
VTHEDATLTHVVPAKTVHLNLSPPFCGERSDRCDDAKASSCDPGEGRGTVLATMTDFSGRKISSVAYGFSVWSDPSDLAVCEHGAPPLTRSLRFASASTSPREERGEVRDALDGNVDVGDAA